MAMAGKAATLEARSATLSAEVVKDFMLCEVKCVVGCIWEGNKKSR